MTYFFNQKRLPIKERKLIRIEDVISSIKITNIENPNLPKKELTKQLNINSQNENNKEKIVKKVSKIEVIKFTKKETPIKSVKSLSKAYNRCIKDVSFLSELEEYLDLTSFIFKLPNYWYDLDLNQLKLHINNFDTLDIGTKTNFLKPPPSISPASKSSSKDRSIKIDSKSRRLSNNPNATQETKLNPLIIQFQLSSEKFVNWLQDKNLQLTLSSVEWALNKLRCIRKKYSEEFEVQTDLITTKPFLVTYRSKKATPKSAPTKSMIRESSPVATDTFLGDINLSDLFERITSNLTQTSDKSAQVKYKTKQCQTVSCGNNYNFTTTVFYPSGRVAINYYKLDEENIMLLHTDDLNNSLTGVLCNTQLNSFIYRVCNPDQLQSSSCTSSTTQLDVVITQSSCTQYHYITDTNRNTTTTSYTQMKWPTSNHNKLSHTIHVKFNEYLSFTCSGKQDMTVKFIDKYHQHGKPLEFPVHKWLFNTLIDKTSLQSTNTSSRTVSEFSKQSNYKHKKEDPEFLPNLERDLATLKTRAENQLEGWISLIRSSLKFEMTRAYTMLHNRPVKSASEFMLRAGSRLSPYKLEVHPPSAHVNRKHPPSSAQQIDQIKLLPEGQMEFQILKSKSQPEIIKSFSLAHQCVHHSKPSILCPRRLFLVDSSSQSECLCSKYQVPEITDAHLTKFLKSVRSDQLVIIAVICTKKSSVQSNSSSNGSASRERVIEDNLAKLITEVYVEDLKNSPQRPCTTYDSKPYRFLFYDMSSCGRFSQSSQSLLMLQNRITPGMCLMFQKGHLLFADFVFNGYNMTKRDLFKQINQTRIYHESGFEIPLDFHLSSSLENQKWLKDMAYSKIKSFSPVK